MEKKFFEEVVAAMAAEGYEVIESSSLTVNVVKRSLQLKNVNSKEAPCLGADVSFDEYFSLWKEKGIDAVVGQLVEIVKESVLSEPEDMRRIIDSAAGIREKDSLLQGVFLQLINTERNTELLREVPHRAFHDLSVIYRYKVTDAGERLGSIVIKSSHLPEGVTEELLYEAACKNTWEMFPWMVKNVENIVGMPAPNMFMLTNEYGVNGAHVLLNPDALRAGAASLGSEKVWILPSSLHELILVPYIGENDADALLRMVYAINRTMLESDAFLSDSVYMFDVNVGEVRMVSDCNCSCDMAG